MVHVTLESKMSFGSRKHSYSYMTSSNLYRVVVNGEEGEYYEYEVEADSFSDASRQGESLAASMVDVQYIEVYQIA